MLETHRYDVSMEKVDAWVTHTGADRTGKQPRRCQQQLPLAGRLAMLGNLLGVDRCLLVPASPPRDAGGYQERKLRPAEWLAPSPTSNEAGGQDPGQRVPTWIPGKTAMWAMPGMEGLNAGKEPAVAKSSPRLTRSRQRLVRCISFLTGILAWRISARMTRTSHWVTRPLPLPLQPGFPRVQNRGWRNTIWGTMTRAIHDSPAKSRPAIPHHGFGCASHL